jgi:hypothetical protein
MYSAVLTIHSWMRWITLITAVAATLNAARQPVRTPDGGERLPGRGWDVLFMLVVDVQMLFGFLLYFGLSPFTKEAMNDMSLAMATPALRFWAVEHAAGMVIAAVLVRVGRVLAAGARSPAAARDRRLVCFILATVGMLASIPWPGLPNGRPLFRL